MVKKRSVRDANCTLSPAIAKVYSTEAGDLALQDAMS